MQMTRRDFLTILAIAPAAWITISHAKNKQPLTLSSLNIHVPVWLFIKNSKETEKALALSIESKQQAKQIVVRFAGNRQLSLNNDTSVRSLMQNNANRPTRESMLLKRIISYSVDAAFTRIANKRHPEKGNSLREEFDALQAEEVIDEISLGALYELLMKLNSLPLFSSLTWDARLKRFVLL